MLATQGPVVESAVKDVSVVIPTYNRGEDLGVVLDRVLASDARGLFEIEIVVVDDGSPLDATPIVKARQAPPSFTLKCIRQENAGPAAARNLGFTASHGDIVIFIDDDILVPPELVRQHVEAHVLNPGAVVFGVCLPPPGARIQIADLLESLYANRPGRPRFERVSLIASGQLSVERACFPQGVYAREFRTPAAEEFELSARLRRLRIPAINATQIRAIHDQGFGTPDVCDQQYKHGIGCAEALCKLPVTDVMPELAKIAALNGHINEHDTLATTCKKIVKLVAATVPVRRTLIVLCDWGSRIIPSRGINLKLLKFAIGVFFFAGYREGLRRFGPGHNDTANQASRCVAS